MDDPGSLDRRVAYSHVCWLGAAILLAGPCLAQPDRADAVYSIQWQDGPRLAPLGEVAQIRVPAGYRFADANNARVLLESTGRAADGTELGLIAPQGVDWFLTFQFNKIGYVSDDEKDSLEADAIMQAIRRNTEKTGDMRPERASAKMTIVGWERIPEYDPATNTLTWVIRGESGGKPIASYNMRRLGRTGVMSMWLVTDPDSLSGVVSEVERIMREFAFTSGERYEEFYPGDESAGYGLAALVAGRPSGGAVFSGASSWIGKAVVAALSALVVITIVIFAAKRAISFLNWGTP